MYYHFFGGALEDAHAVINISDRITAKIHITKIPNCLKFITTKFLFK